MWLDTNSCRAVQRTRCKWCDIDKLSCRNEASSVISRHILICESWPIRAAIANQHWDPPGMYDAEDYRWKFIHWFSDFMHDTTYLHVWRESPQNILVFKLVTSENLHPIWCEHDIMIHRSPFYSELNSAIKLFPIFWGPSGTPSRTLVGPLTHKG